jgi:hypothetical protein
MYLYQNVIFWSSDILDSIFTYRIDTLTLSKSGHTLTLTESGHSLWLDLWFLLHPGDHMRSGGGQSRSQGIFDDVSYVWGHGVEGLL